MSGKTKPGPGTTERPILFNGTMVRAILEGRKTVTLRPVKGGQIPNERHDQIDPAFCWSAIGQHDRRYGFNVFGATERECARQLAEYGRCPYGRPGDRLWVRETWQGPLVDDSEQRADLSWWKDRSRYQNSAHCAYQASGDSCELVDPDGDIQCRWKPSIHMPRWASRILLVITDLRVERLQDITEEQALAEGAKPESCDHARQACAAIVLPRAVRRLQSETPGGIRLDSHPQHRLAQRSPGRSDLRPRRRLAPAAPVSIPCPMR